MAKKTFRRMSVQKGRSQGRQSTLARTDDKLTRRRGLWKDTVSADEEDDEVDADQHAGE